MSLEKDKNVVGLGTAEYGFLTSLDLSLYAEVYSVETTAEYNKHSQHILQCLRKKICN